MQSNDSTYRTSHTCKGYGEVYQRTYSDGYYSYLWNKIERPIVSNVLSEIHGHGAITCLDFACGTGRVTEVDQKYFDDVVGVDISEEMLSVAKQRLPDVRLIRQDVTETPLSTKFDVITSFRFFLNAEDGLRKQVLDSIGKMLHDNGHLVANVHINKYSPLGRFYRVRNKLRGTVLANTLGWKEFSDILGNSGFSIVDTHWYGYYPRTGWRLGWMANMLMLPTEHLCRALPFVPKQWAQNFLVVCKKT